MNGPDILRLEGSDRLAGPPDDAPIHREAVALTGGGLVGVVEPRSGLRSIWRGERSPLVRMDMNPGRTSTSGDPRLRATAGCWCREIRLYDGSRVLERGLLPDASASPVIEWTLEGRAGPLVVSIRVSGDHDSRAETEVALHPGRPVAFCVLPPGADPGAARRLMRPLRARERQRQRRSGSAAPDGIHFEVDGSAVHAVRAAVRTLEGSALAFPDPDPSERGDRFLAGLSDGAPRLLEPGGLAELGLAALVAGRSPLGKRLLRAVMEATDPPALLGLFFAARYAHWTGEPQELLPYSERLLELARLLVPDAPPAAFPSPARTLEILIAGLEPMGELPWLAELRSTQTALRATPPGPPRSLPVLGMEPATQAPDPVDTEPVLPPAEAFSDPDGPGIGGRRTLHSARLLRSWVEGLLGARPDGAYGRLTLAPEPSPGWRTFGVRGLRVADASVELGYRRRGRIHTFSLRQTAGRVPLNLVFAPTLPLSGIEAVRIGDEPADVEVFGTGETRSIRCQFPLDPDREVTVVGAPGPRDRPASPRIA